MRMFGDNRVELTSLPTRASCSACSGAQNIRVIGLLCFTVQHDSWGGVVLLQEDILTNQRSVSGHLTRIDQSEWQDVSNWISCILCTLITTAGGENNDDRHLLQG